MAGGLCLEELNGQLNFGEESCGNLMWIMLHGYLNTASLIGSIITGLVMHPEIQTQVSFFLQQKKLFLFFFPRQTGYAWHVLIILLLSDLYGTSWRKKYVG